MTIFTKRHMSMIVVAALLTGCGGNGSSVDSNTTASSSSIQDNYGNTYLEVTSPTTGQIWLDRNLGATQVCTTATDAACQGDLFQWGRPADGHQFTTSTENTVPFTSIAPDITSDPTTYNHFIKSGVSNTYQDWTTADTTKVSRATFMFDATTSKLCPVGYRVPTSVEWQNETTLHPNTLLSSFLKMSDLRRRLPDVGTIMQFGSMWTSSIDVTNGGEPYAIYFLLGAPAVGAEYTAVGQAIRCIKP